MKLVHQKTKRELNKGDTIQVTAKCEWKGEWVEVQAINEPSEQWPDGLIIFNQLGLSWQQLIPTVFGYEWVE